VLAFFQEDAMTADQKLQMLVLEAFDYQPNLDRSHIGVAVRNGIVTLSGHVGTNDEKRAVEIAAGCVPGAKAVIDNVLVEMPWRVQTADEVTAESCLARLAADDEVDLDRVHIAVTDGVVTIHGDVDHERERDRIEALLPKGRFLQGVVNELKVKRPVRADFVRQKVREALQPISPINSEKIEVKTVGTHVILKGAVNSWHERGIAESAAWSVPGVSSIDDQLGVRQ
jgi:osmotically-inducible protein OsmY